jgi:hypothetical protein
VDSATSGKDEASEEPISYICNLERGDVLMLSGDTKEGVHWEVLDYTLERGDADLESNLDEADQVDIRVWVDVGEQQEGYFSLYGPFDSIGDLEAIIESETPNYLELVSGEV